MASAESIRSLSPGVWARLIGRLAAGLSPEMGHQFQIYAGDPQVHCSNNAYTPPSDSEKCIMNYSGTFTNDKARFCKDHISDGMTSQPSIRDIPDNR